MKQPMESILYNLVKQGIWTIDKNGKIWKTKNGKKKTVEHLTPQGYMQSRKMIAGYRIGTGSHRIIWTHYNGTIPQGKTINHKNGKKDDNRIENLELATYSEQAIHALHILKHGRIDQRGEKNSMSKLTAMAVKEIMMQKGQIVSEMKTRHGHRIKLLAKKYKVSYQAIWEVVRGYHWTSV